MTTHKMTSLISRLEQGLIMDPTRLKALDDELATLFQDMRKFGGGREVSIDWQRQWLQHTDDLESALFEIRLKIKEVDKSIESQEGNRLETPLLGGEFAPEAEFQLHQTIDALCSQVAELDVVSQEVWQSHISALENHVKTIEVCAETTKAKREILRAHSKEDVELAIQNILSRLPDLAPAADEVRNERQKKLDEAAIELNSEQHEVIGLMGIIKAMFLWVENPAERVKKREAVEAVPPVVGQVDEAPRRAGE